MERSPVTVLPMIYQNGLSKQSENTQQLEFVHYRGDHFSNCIYPPKTRTLGSPELLSYRSLVVCVRMSGMRVCMDNLLLGTRSSPFIFTATNYSF